MRAVITTIALVAALVAVAPGEAQTTRQQRDAAEAAASYEKGLVFTQQGAWKEAEKEFRNAERKTNDKVDEYVFATAYTYLKLHKANDALKRYERIYKREPTNLRAIVGMAAAYEDMQRYADAVRIWQRYVRMPLPPAEKAEGEAMLNGARQLFAEYYEIAENPAGGAPNLATPEQELAWGLGYAQQLAASGVPLITDPAITGYVEDMCRRLVAHAKRFPTNYEVFVLDSMTVNAMTTPGFIFVYRGILDAVRTEEELAGVLAHEVGHSVARHVAKMQTKIAQDQQQLEKLQQSDSKFSRFLAKMLEVGNPLGALTFSRENEAQADRLGVHIAYDAGYDPSGLVGMFRTFESMSPSSRSSWDLMTRTHPFSIDRVNAVTEYVALLPPRPPRAPSPAFAAMKARLAELPPANDAVGLMRPAVPTPGTTPGSPASTRGATRDFSIDGTPLTGEIPADWVARKTEAGTIVFEGTQGTEAYEMSVELEVQPKALAPARTLDDLAQVVQAHLRGRQDAEVQDVRATQTDRGQAARVVAANFNVAVPQGLVPFAQISVVIDYPGHLIILSYYGPATLFEKYSGVFELIGDSLRYGGR
ncbi:MAG: M48 family metalloprotease [Vicinamibacterales bacterium]|nr:M48 family metalloprotease [Vicinamibacterales bacterium]